MTTETPAERSVSRLHEVYCAHTGQKVRLAHYRVAAWMAWLKVMRESFPEVPPEQLLITTISHIKAGIAAGTRNEGALRFSNLIEQVDYAEESVAMALAVKRNKVKVDPAAQYCREDFRKPQAPKPVDEPKKVGEIIASQAFQEFIALRKTL